MLRIRTALGAGLAAAACAAAPAAADLASSYQSGQDRARTLQGRIGSESDLIGGYEGSLSSLRTRLDAIQRNVTVQERLLAGVTTQLGRDRRRLTGLRATYVHDRAALAAQLRAQYESPSPTVLNVVVESGGFDDLVNGLRDLTAIRARNVRTIRGVADARDAVAAQTRRLAAAEVRRRRATTTVLDERDQVARLRGSIVRRELRVRRARHQDTTELTRLHRRLVHQARVLDARAARAGALSSGGAPVDPPGGCTSAPYVAHGGAYGFFPAAGTNYSEGVEPQLAGRLDQLGRALQLHLVGISGYRSPAHSVEVGGFADDPHTRGLASDTPGVEGVPESTLNRFCLTRPFGGTAEADHIQEH